MSDANLDGIRHQIDTLSRSPEQDVALVCLARCEFALDEMYDNITIKVTPYMWVHNTIAIKSGKMNGYNMWWWLDRAGNLKVADCHARDSIKEALRNRQEIANV